MCKADTHAHKISSLLVRVAKITRSAVIHKDYNMFVNKETASNVFRSLASKTQDILLRIGTDLASSKEYEYKDVIRYFILYYLDKGEEIDIRDLDYQKLRRNFIGVHGTFSKEFHIEYTSSILKDLEKVKYKLKDLGNLKEETSILFDVYKTGYPISTCVFFLDCYKSLGNKIELNESEEHFRFRKALKLLKEVSKI